MNPPQKTQETIPVLHVTIASVKPFDEVKGALEWLVPRLDEGVFKLLRKGKGEQALRGLEVGPALFHFRDHGAGHERGFRDESSLPQILERLR